MAQRRAAAAEIFQQQNMLTETDDALDQYAPEQSKKEFYRDKIEDMDEITLSAGFASRAPGGPPPQPAPMVMPQSASRKKAPAMPQLFSFKTSEELQLEKEPIQVRETGIWFWKRVIIPPNAYVVHTRLGKKDPVTLGLGVSFRYNPNTDAYLVVPAAMQTIGVVANCITREKQGINVLAYVQWQISDFSVAYRKLDISDPRDPLGIVNAQLREQAEAAIKDKIATMSVEEVLTDKAPVIEELTRRLIAVTEGRLQTTPGASGEGLGIRIATVQIKEARVSSQRLWENLQAPFRHEQEKEARLSYLRMQEDIRQKELETRQITETSEAEATVVIERIKQTKDTEAVQLRLEEEAKRFAQEQTAERQRIQLEAETTLVEEESERRLAAERARIQQEANLAQLQREQQAAIERTRLEAQTEADQKQARIEQKLREMTEEQRLAEQEAASERERLSRDAALKQAEHAYLAETQRLETLREQQALEDRLERERVTSTVRLELEEAAGQLRYRQQELEAQIARIYQETRNLMNERDLQRILIERLPELAAHMPEIKEMRVIQTGDGNNSGLAAFIGGLMAAIEAARASLVNGTVTVKPDTPPSG